MSLLASCAQDLYQKIQAIPALASSTGFTLAGKAPDPGATKVSLPAAWPIFSHAVSLQSPNEALPSANVQSTLYFVVALYIANEDQVDLFANQFPLIGQVISAVHGTTAPSGVRWRWIETLKPTINPNRYIYPISFAVDAATAP